MVDWLIIGVYGTFAALGVIFYFLSPLFFLGLGYLDAYYQDRYFEKQFSKKKVVVEDNELQSKAA